ncbi:MAG: glycosyltransferase [Planctomycetota bacterium]
MASSMRGGGSERQVWLLTKHLDRGRFQPFLYLTHLEGHYLDQIPSDVPILHCETKSSGSRLYFPGRHLRQQSLALTELVTQHSIDVVYDRTFHMTLLAGGLPRSVRRVSTIVSPPHLAVPFVEKRFVFLKRKRLRNSYLRSDSIIAVSQAAADSAQDYYRLGNKPIHVIRNGVDHVGLRSQTLESRPKDRSAQGLDHSRQLLCVGRMTEEKGHADLLQAFSLLRRESAQPVQLKLVGDGPLRSSLQELARQLDLDDAVQFVGASSSVASEIATADALVLPSRFEGLPNVVLEAMAIGTPVIATRAGGTPELQPDRPTAFWAQPNDPESLKQALLEFMQNPFSANEQSEAALKLIQSEHDLNDSIRRIEAQLAPQS